MEREIPFQKRSRLLSKRDCPGTLLSRSINQQMHRESYSILLKRLEKIQQHETLKNVILQGYFHVILVNKIDAKHIDGHCMALENFANYQQ